MTPHLEDLILLYILLGVTHAWRTTTQWGFASMVPNNNFKNAKLWQATKIMMRESMTPTRRKLKGQGNWGMRCVHVLLPSFHYAHFFMIKSCFKVAYLYNQIHVIVP